MRTETKPKNSEVSREIGKILSSFYFIRPDRKGIKDFLAGQTGNKLPEIKKGTFP